ncbi:fimbrillin family protein [Bacteroides fragilis]|uniref:fimbrillin family protein n=1 Tax=Bacteroides fragilis TaxID=817 RepID=UPI001CA839FF|nr:fimbrillin family protein [Bacteroides fragilis]MCM0327155.1 fimbrillin family protein [Bacteroides fragilis]
MDTNNKYTYPRAIILAACSLLLAGACDNYDGPGSDTPGREVRLNFNASIENTEGGQSRSITGITDFSGNSYAFGMSVTKSENGSEIFKGSSDMTATMERSGATAPWNWSFLDNSDHSSVTPAGPEGKALKVVAYYPAVSSATKDVYTNGIPFDFSAKTGLKQTDLLYNTSTIYPFVPSDGSVATVPLNFRHAYTWIVLNITKYVNKGGEFKLSSVTLDNLGANWIKNKGAIDPETGLPKDGAVAGPISITIEPAVILSTTEVYTCEFLVPSFMDTKVGNGEITLILNINGINEIFSLDKIYLNQSDDRQSFGFRQGYKNTYDLVFNNSALGLNIQGWSSEVINGEFGGDITPPGDQNYKWMNLNNDGFAYWPTATYPGAPYATKYPPKSGYLTANEHPYEAYLTTVAYGGNGAYVPVNTPDPATLPKDGLNITDDINVYTMEKAHQILQMTRNDVSIAPVPWEDGNGLLLAKELCRKYNGGGFHNWRLPRASELRAVFVLVTGNGSSLSDLGFSLDDNRNKPYWTGTEVNENEAWGLYIDNKGTVQESTVVLSPYDKKTTSCSVRCVRDSN